MITISLCMIVKNEQYTLPRCLNSVKDLVDEIMIVDTGSTDNTKNVVKQYTQHIYDFKWIEDFSAARNFSFSKATQNYILWLDADDILLPKDQQRLKQLKHTLEPKIDAVSMEYHCDFDEFGNVTLNVRRFRLVKRSKQFKWEGAVHEDIVVSGMFMDSDITVTHIQEHPATDRNLTIYQRRMKKGLPFTARDLFHFARELHQHKKYKQAVPYYQKFLNQNNSSDEDKILVCSRLADCYYHLGERKKEREWVYQSFEYGTPRSEFCCRLGYYFLEEKKYPQAIFWYNLATELPKPNHNWSVQHLPSQTWLPHMQLGLCYYQVGDYEKSYAHNKIALLYRPDDEQLANNISLLEEILQKKER